MPSQPGQRVGHLDVDRLAGQRPDQLVHVVQAGAQVGLDPQPGRAQQGRHQGRDRGVRPRPGGQVGGQVGQQVALVGHAVAPEGADDPEQVVDGQVVAEALVGHGVVADGVAGLVEAGQQPPQPVGGRRLEVVALVVAVAEPGRPAPGQLDHAVLLVGLQGDPPGAVQPQQRVGGHRQVAAEPLRGHLGGRPAGGRGQLPDERRPAATARRPGRGGRGRPPRWRRCRCRPGTGSRAAPPRSPTRARSSPVRTVSHAGSRTIANQGKRAASSSPSPAASSRWTSTPRASSLARLTRTELVMRTPSDSLSMNGASARYTVRTDEVADQGRPWGPRSASSPAPSRARHLGLLQQAGGLPGVGGDQGVAAARSAARRLRVGRLVAGQQPGQQLGRPGPEGGVLGHERRVGPEPVQRERRPKLGGVAAHLAGGHGLAALGRGVQGVPGGQGLLGPEERRHPGPVLRPVGPGQERRDVAGRVGHRGHELARPGPAPLGEGELPAEQGGQGDVVEGDGRPAGGRARVAGSW